jgi:hypothetical protein
MEAKETRKGDGSDMRGPEGYEGSRGCGRNTEKETRKNNTKENGHPPPFTDGDQSAEIDGVLNAVPI